MFWLHISWMCFGRSVRNFSASQTRTYLEHSELQWTNMHLNFCDCIVPEKDLLERNWKISWIILMMRYSVKGLFIMLCEIFFLSAIFLKSKYSVFFFFLVDQHCQSSQGCCTSRPSSVSSGWLKGFFQTMSGKCCTPQKGSILILTCPWQSF